MITLPPTPFHLVALSRHSPHHTPMKELFVYGISSIASLFIFGYCVHIFVGGLVSEGTEIILISVVVMIAAAVTAYLLWDSRRRR